MPAAIAAALTAVINPRRRRSGSTLRWRWAGTSITGTALPPVVRLAGEQWSRCVVLRGLAVRAESGRGRGQVG